LSRIRLMSVLAASLLTACAQETGTHWASPGEFGVLKGLGYQFVVTTVTTNPQDWAATFDAADAHGLKLIVGIYPPPYTLTSGAWTITPQGEAFVRYAASRSRTVKAIFGFNEPYWINPWTGQSSYCGQLSAADLRGFRTLIRRIWPEAKIFHDIGAPSEWAPGGTIASNNACVGNKYADQRGVADSAGIWFYPFDRLRYLKDQGLTALRKDIDYVKTSMQAEAIVDMQAFRCRNCGEATRFPNDDELKDWNCAVRGLGPAAVSWYVWRQSIYDDYLANHPGSWNATTAGVCGPLAAEFNLNSIASAAAMQSALPVAPGSIVSLFGKGFVAEPVFANTPDLPRELASVRVLMNGVAAPLSFVGPTQINAQVPFEVPAGEATLQVAVNQRMSNGLRFRVVDPAPHVFTVNQAGSGPAVALDAVTNRLITSESRAARGSYAVLYCTGLGRMKSAVATGSGAAAANEAVAPVTASLAGVNALVLYAGATPGFAGLYQVNLQIPELAPSGEQPVRLTQGGMQSNLVTVYIQ
jgi:uncharacterized protein (TIGR03437 family)